MWVVKVENSYSDNISARKAGFQHSLRLELRSSGLRFLYSELLKLSETIGDMVAYTKVTDGILLNILHSTDPELQKARQILHNIECRRLYRFIGQTNPKIAREDVTVKTVFPVSFSFIS